MLRSTPDQNVRPLHNPHPHPQVGVGEHGLLRLLSSDWDDGFKPPPAAEPVVRVCVRV